MQQLTYFIQKYKYFLFFLLLAFVALVLVINNHSFHKSKIVSSVNAITGGILNKTATFSDYLHLKEQNEELSKENNRLKNLIEKYKTVFDSVTVTTLNDSIYKQEYTYITGKIVNNQYYTPYNFITINRGTNDNVTTEMAIINSKGIIGITENVSANYTRVQSILNKHSKINAKFKHNNYFGTLTWDGKDYNTVQLTDIPRQANFNIGDTIITGGKSAIFPKGIPIGTILDLPKGLSVTKVINVRLFNDMSNLGPVSIVINLNKKEIRQLENATNE